jgi:hypothetical protein
MNQFFFSLRARCAVIHGQLGTKQLLCHWDNDKVTALLEVVGQPSEGKRTNSRERWYVHKVIDQYLQRGI